MPLLTTENANPLYAETYFIAALPSEQQDPYKTALAVTANNDPTNARDPIAQIVFTTGLPRSFYTITLNGAGIIYSAPMEHSSGIIGGQLNVMMGGKTHPVGAGAVTFAMYTDSTKTTLLCQVAGTYDRTTNKLSITGSSTCSTSSSSVSSSSSSSSISSVVSSSSVSSSTSSSSASSLSSTASTTSSSSSAVNTITPAESTQLQPYMSHITNLRNQYGFTATSIALEYNKKGAQEKWFYGSDGSAFHILPDGSLWKGTTPNRTGTLIAAFPKVVYDNAELLFVTITSSSSSLSSSVSSSSTSSSVSSSSSSISSSVSSSSNTSVSSSSSSSASSVNSSSSNSSSSSNPPPPTYEDPMETTLPPDNLTLTEKRLQAFAAIKTQLSTMLNRLATQSTNNVALKKSIQDAKLVAEQALAQANAILAKAEQERLNPVYVTPSLTGRVVLNEKFATVEYRDAVQGITVSLNGKTPMTLPAGTGKVQLTIPLTATTVTYNVEVRDKTGKVLGTLLTFTASLQKAKSSVTRTESYPALRYAIAPTITPAAEEAAKIQKQDAEKILADFPVQMTSIDQSQLRIVEDSDALHREMIPYSRMFVEPVNHPENLKNPYFSVRFMSDQPQSYFEIDLTGVGVIGTRTIEHPTGTEDSTVTFEIGQNQRGNYGHGDVHIMMYTDESKQHLLAKYTGFYDRNTYKVEDATQQIPWGTMETGRLDLSVIDSDLGVISLKGPNVLLFMQTPYDHSAVTMEGGGMFAARYLHHEGGTSAEPISLTFNGEKPSGTYAIRLLSSIGGMEVDRIVLRWDTATKTLSLTNADDRTDSLDPSLTEAQELFNRQTSLTTIDVSGTALRDVQGIELYQKSRFFISGDSIESYVRKAYPENFPVDQEKYIQEQAVIQKKTPGQIRDSLVRTQLDLFSVARANLGVYESLMGGIMEDAVEVVVAAKNGSGEPAARTTLQNSINFASNHLRIRELWRLGIYIPTFDPVLEEGVRLFGSELDTLLARQSIIVKLREEELNKYVKADTDAEPKLISSNAFLGGVRNLEAAYKNDPAGLKNALNNYYLSRAREYLTYYGITPDPTIDARSQVAFMLGVTPVVARAGEYAQWEPARFSDYERELAELRAEWETLIAEYGNEANALAKQWIANGDAILNVGSLAAADANLINSGELFTSDFLQENVTHVFSEEWQTLQRAKNALTIEERQRALLEGGLADEIKGDGTKAGTLVVLVNGHLQHIGDDPNKAGIETAKKVLSEQGYDILHFRVGTAVIPFSNVQTLNEVSELVLLDRITRTGIFKNRAPVNRIIIAGYSWGGGTAVNFVNRIKNSELISNIPVDLAVIDAVKLGEKYAAQPVTTRPDALRVFNRFQENGIVNHIIENKNMAPSRIFGTALLYVMTKGFPARGSLLFGKTHPQDDQKSVGTAYNHLSIDDGGESGSVNRELLEFFQKIQ